MWLVAERGRDATDDVRARFPEWKYSGVAYLCPQSRRVLAIGDAILGEASQGHHSACGSTLGSADPRPFVKLRERGAATVRRLESKCDRAPVSDILRPAVRNPARRRSPCELELAPDRANHRRHTGV
jgi:hypothetical protein